MRCRLWEDTLLHDWRVARQHGMEAYGRTNRNNVSLVSAVALVGYLDPALQARSDGFGGAMDWAEGRGGQGARPPHCQQEGGLALLRCVCFRHTGNLRISAECGRL